MKSTTTLISSLGVLLFAALPVHAQAAVQITEVMYDLEGADGGFEWIEVTNTGSSAVDIGPWRLFEGNTNHKLKLVTGQSPVLAPGASAIIADRSENFSSHWPNVALVFDSAFSLSNTGEQLSLKNGAEMVDEMSYTSELGAKGDGGSLHRQGASFVAALPTPGVFPGELRSVPAKQTAAPTNTKSPAVQKESDKNAAPALGNAQLAAAGTAPSNSLWPWLIGLVSIMGLGIAAVFLARMQEPIKETIDPGSEFELID